MVADLLAHYVSLSIRKALTDSALVTLIQVQGHASPPAESVEEWLQFDLMAFNRRASRKNNWIGTVMFQVTSFSRMANQRQDHEVNAPWILSSHVRDLLADHDLEVREYGETGEALIATLEIGKEQSTYEKGLGASAASGAHAVVSVFSATLVKTN